MPRISGDSLQQHRELLQGRVFAAFAELMSERSFDAESPFTIEDVDATMSLIHAGLSPRHLPARTIESFVLRAVGTAGS